MIFHHGIYAGLNIGPTVAPYALPATGLLLDLDATTGITVSDGIVTAVAERGPNSEPVIVTGPAAYNATGINGRPAINTNAGAFLTGNSISVGSRTYYTVATILGNSPDGFATFLYQNAAPYCQLYANNGGNFQLYINSVKGSGIGYTVGTPMVIKAVIDVNTNQITVNGVAGTLNAHDAFSAVDYPFKIANAGGTSNILLGRQVLYNGVPSTDDDTAIINTLKAQFGITF